MSGMPDKGHCACKFSSGGVLSKTCAWHEAMSKDAARYRWLRENDENAWEDAGVVAFYDWILTQRGDGLDAAIDAARANVSPIRDRTHGGEG